MMMNVVVCTIAILVAPNNRIVDTLRGVVVADKGSHILVDFSEDFAKKHYDNEIQPSVQKVNENNCLYE